MARAYEDGKLRLKLAAVAERTKARARERGAEVYRSIT